MGCNYDFGSDDPAAPARWSLEQVLLAQVEVA